MGNVESGQVGGAASVFRKVTGASSHSSRSNKIVVVRNNTESGGNKTEDADLERLREIPLFLPLLRSVLAQPGLKDPPDLYTKFPVQPLLALCRRLQRHLTLTSEMVADEQSLLVSKIRQLDCLVIRLCNQMTNRKGRQERHAHLLQRVREIDVALHKVNDSLRRVASLMDVLNLQLPLSERLPPLNFGHPIEYFNVPSFEQQVVDR